MKYRPRMAIQMFLWLPMIAAKITGALLGLVLVPIGIFISESQQKKWPKLLWLWGNDEEWVPQWWLNKTPRFPRFLWLAIRNPFGNFRYLWEDKGPYHDYTNWREDELPMEARQMLDKGYGVAWRYRQRGWKSGYRRVWIASDTSKYSEFWLGWKVGSEVPGLGFAMQLRLKRKVGT